MTVNKILKNSSLYTFCALLQKGTGFLLLPIYTTYLKPEDYGIMNLITSITGFLSILFLVSLHAAAARFHFKYVTSKGQAIVWGTILLMVLFNSAFWGLICIIFHDALLVPLAEGIPFYPLLLLAILGTMLSPLYLFYQQWLQCTQDGLRYTLNLMCNFLLQVFLNLLMLMVFHQGVLGIIISSFIVSMIFFIYSMISFLPHITLCINKEISVAAFKYSLPLIPHSVSGYLSVMLDRILLNKLIGIQQVGLYGVANQFGNILNLFTSSINQAFTPWLYQKLEKENESSNYKSIYKFAEISNVLCCFVALVITFFSPEFIRLMTTDEFYSSWQPIVFITFGYVLNGLYFFFSKSLFFSYTNLVSINVNRRVVLLGILYVLEFLYAKRLPLLEILLGTEGFVHFGGIPTIHVLLVTYTVFFSTFIFHRLICNFSRKLLYNFLIIAFFPPLLMVNRGMLFTIFFACLFVYLFSLKAFKRKILIYCIISISLALYLFSIIGSVRINDDENSTVFVAFTQPTDDFESLGISNMFLWPYMYIASPIGNLQNCIDIYQPTGSFSTFFWKCICPDFISKHFYKSELESPPLISPVFNVSTMYTDAYAQLGYLGMGILFVMQTFVLYTVLLAFSAKKNPYYTTTVSLSCSVVILNAFANMWTFSAISFPIIWGPISYFLRKIRW